MSVFPKLPGFGYVHHRALNSLSGIDAALESVKAFPHLSHILEGDICWDFSDGRREFYFRHPDFVFDTLSHDLIRKLRDIGQLSCLKDIAKAKNSECFFVLELKVGRGNSRQAVKELVHQLERELPGRYWIDTFSIGLLRYIKSIYPNTPVSLHTEMVKNSRAFVGAPDWPFFGIPRLTSLSEIDAITIRRRFSDDFMRKSSSDVLKSGKTLLMSRLHSVENLGLAKEVGAAAGYIHTKNFAEFVDAELAASYPQEK